MRPPRRRVPENPATVRRRLVALTGTLSAFVALTLVVVVQVVLAGASTSAVERVLADRADAVIDSAEATSDPGTLTVSSTRLDPGVAVYGADGARVAGTVPPSLREGFERLSHSAVEQTTEVGEAYSVLARPFALDGGTRGVVVVAEPLAPYENDEHTALVVSITAGALMIVLALALATWISRKALAPVQVMADTAREWSEHDLERRFDLGPPTDEIRSLGHTLDELLDKVAAAIRAEQRLTSELAHELRTPLTAIQGTAELLAMRPDLDEQLREDVEDIRAGCRAMATTMSVLLEIARRQASGSPTSTTSAAELTALVLEQHVRPGLRLDLAPDLLLAAPPQVVLRALTPLLHNALAVADNVTLTSEVSPDPAISLLHVSDDGPGIDAAVVGRLFQPGTTTRDGAGSGLGLSLARRVARSVGGDVALLHATGAGTTFVVSLPACSATSDDQS
ncbi:MAG: HAMP domain-containing sensor histidine kinase [Nocardioides sp.]|uniref:sensor histidine kinase n=1 Tax=Nocardioides sp. TaxID=35761 RepID=UPI002393A133|nr:HAMP domain-containing sensor histidine kinase [Nocardioides sp.]MDE0775824.1 HAMP domain-containing sensor histidine kinase [Nocardioides sp.]